MKESQEFSKVRVNFDRYIASSLKSYTRTTHRARDLIQYKIHDKCKTGHLETKEFLANNETKNDLTRYVALKLVTVKTGNINSGNCCICNCVW